MESDSVSDHDEDSKQRGPTTKAKANKVKLVITYNKKGVPVGKEATKLSTFEGLVARIMVPISYESWLEVSEEEKFVVDPKSWKQTVQSIGKKWRNFKHYLYAKFIKNRSKYPKANLFKPPKDYLFIKKEDRKVFVSHRVTKKWEEKSTKAKNTRAHQKYNHRLSRKGYARLNEIMQETGKTEEEIDRTLLWKKARELKTGGYESDVKMIVDKIDELQKSGSFGEVTCGTHDVLTEALGTQEQRGRVRGMGKFITPQQYFYLPKNVKYYLEIENDRVDKRINKLEDDWRRKEKEGKVTGKPVKKHATPVKKHATPVTDGATPLKEEIGSNKKEKGTGKMIDEQKEPYDVEEGDDMEEGNGIEKKIKKKEKHNVTLQRRWTRAQMKTMIRIEKSSILKMTAMMAVGQVTKVDSIKVQSENDLFGYDSYTYLTWDDFEAVLTMDELTGVVIVSYMMVLFNKMKYGSPERDHGICFVNPTLISPSTRKGRSKNIDDASRGLADWLSKRKGNDIVFMPYNRGRRHLVLGVLDMKSDNCYYLDSLSSGNFNMHLKQIVDSTMVMYATQSGSNKRVKLNWVNVMCPVQPGATECSYYMLRFLKETGEGKFEYTTDDIDKIREEWSEFVTGFIYR
ncbi:unnamed protein product [Lactuca virosa]|uniref:Ubiquitin-like protease family profile domain-containing protein n=1 Tax=Lactuca virosa TaxID=75947 RepID=A0AAU9PI49_9ASTR|nr:unnamed protein product [Lactuca virosa]